jgi:hypothetical protein
MAADLRDIILDALGWTEFPRGDDFEFFEEPEPCDNCDEGLVTVFNYENRRLCRRCMIEHADSMGWMEAPKDAEVKWFVLEAPVGEPEVQDSEEPEQPTSGQDSLW